jgi:aminodeoxyfutalosine synthase
MPAGESSEWRDLLSRNLHASVWPSEFEQIVNKLSNGEKLSRSDGHFLFNSKDLDTIGRIANIVKYARFGNSAFFNVNVHINQTNICTLACRFCAFRRGRRAKDAYAMDIEEYVADLRNYANHVDEVHSVGGLHPDWDVEHYSALFARVKKEFPEIHIKALTAVEIKHISKLSGTTIRTTLKRLSEAGLGSLPGGGAEILDDDVRAIICKGKESSSEYLEIHQTAHELGIPTNCTMLFGTVETIDQRLTHLLRLRDLQDKTEGFQCFVPYPFLPDDSRLPEAQLASGTEILRMIAISRLMLDNIPHIKAYRMNIGDEIAELALQFGADDIDGTVQKESIMHLAGSNAPLDHDKEKLAKIVINSGSKPIQRNTTYTSFEEYILPKAPARRHLRMAAGE